MRALQPLETILPPGKMQTWYCVFKRALLDPGHVPQKDFPFNNFREPIQQYILKHSVESRTLYLNSVIS